MKCLICYVEDGVPDNNEHPPPPPRAGGLEEEETSVISQEGRRVTQVVREMQIVFVLRHLLEVPQEELMSHLVKWGNPSGWVNFCGKCQGAVNNAANIYREIVDSRRILRRVKKEIVEVVKRSREREERVHQEEISITEVTEKTRDYVEKHNYDFTDDPYVRGDLKAEELIKIRLTRMEEEKAALERREEEEKLYVEVETSEMNLVDLESEEHVEVDKKSPCVMNAVVVETLDEESNASTGSVQILSPEELEEPTQCTPKENIPPPSQLPEDPDPSHSSQNTLLDKEKETSNKIEQHADKIDVTQIKTEDSIDFSSTLPLPTSSPSPNNPFVKQEVVIKKEDIDKEDIDETKSNNSLQLSFKIPKVPVFKKTVPADKPLKNDAIILQEANAAITKSLLASANAKPPSPPSPPPVVVSIQEAVPLNQKTASTTDSVQTTAPPVPVLAHLRPPPPPTRMLPSSSSTPNKVNPNTVVPNLPSPIAAPSNPLEGLDPFLQELLAGPSMSYPTPGASVLPTPGPYPIPPIPPAIPNPSTNANQPFHFSSSELLTRHARQGQVLGGRGNYRFLCLCGKTYSTNTLLNRHIQRIKMKQLGLDPTSTPRPASSNIVQNATNELRNLQRNIAIEQHTRQASFKNSPAKNCTNVMKQLSSVVRSPEASKSTQDIAKQRVRALLLQRKAHQQRPVPSSSSSSPPKVQRVARAHFTPRLSPLKSQISYFSAKSPPKPQTVARPINNPRVIPKRMFAPTSASATASKSTSPPATETVTASTTPSPSSPNDAYSKPYFKEGGYFCELCPNSPTILRRFRYIGDLDTHMKIIHGGWYKCVEAQCSRQFQIYTDLLIHVEDDHRGQNKESEVAFNTSEAQVIQTSPIRIGIGAPRGCARKRTAVRPMPGGVATMHSPTPPLRGVIRRRGMFTSPVPRMRPSLPPPGTNREEDIPCIQLDD